jgi:hypothetical protein
MAQNPSQRRRMIELRKHPRIFTPASALVSFKRLVVPVRSEEESEGEATLLELSLGGCRIQSDVPLSLGKEYSLILQFSGEKKPVRIETAIVRWVKDGTYGLKFMALPLKEESRIKELVKEGRHPSN